MKLKKLLLAPLVLLGIQAVHAHCPLCTIATGAAVAATRYFGVDDLIVGTFVGAFTISTALWISNWLLKRNKGEDYVFAQGHIIWILSLVSTIITFKMAGLLTPPSELFTLFGWSKLLLGTLAGSAITLASFWLSDYAKARNNNKSIVPFQGIWLTLGLIGVANIVFYLLKWM